MNVEQQNWINRRNKLRKKIDKRVENICCIYPSTRGFLYDEPRERLVGQIASLIEDILDGKEQLT